MGNTASTVKKKMNQTETQAPADLNLLQEEPSMCQLVLLFLTT